MEAAEFLYPSDLSVTGTNIKKVLLVGSCVARGYLQNFRRIAKDVTFTYSGTNNVSILPDLPDEELRSYDFQYISLPLREVLTDRVVRYGDISEQAAMDKILLAAKQKMRLMLEAALKYNSSHNLLTIVANFSVPQVPVVNSIANIGGPLDLNSIVRSLNYDLAVFVQGQRNAYVADVDSLGSSLGKRYFQDDLIAFYSHAAYWIPAFTDYDTKASLNAPIPGRIDPLPDLDVFYGSHAGQYFEAVWRQAEYLYRVSKQIDVVKLVIFDLDDTLWRGQIAEHYADRIAYPHVEGWPIGLWEAIQHLRARGIMTAICSKNEESLVKSRWGNAIRPPWI